MPRPMGIMLGRGKGCSGSQLRVSCISFQGGSAHAPVPVCEPSPNACMASLRASLRRIACQVCASPHRHPCRNPPSPPRQILSTIRDGCLKELGDLQIKTKITIPQAVKALQRAQEQFKLAMGVQMITKP